MKITLTPESEQELKDYPEPRVFEKVQVFALGVCTDPLPIPGKHVFNCSFFHGPCLSVMHGLAELNYTMIKELIERE